VAVCLPTAQPGGRAVRSICGNYVPTIRLANAEDAPAMGAVHVSSWRAAYAGLIDLAYLDSLSVMKYACGWAMSFETRDAQRDPAWVAVEGDRVVGIASAGPTRDENENTATVGEIYLVYVHPEHWGTGAGRALMHTALDFLRRKQFRQAIVWVLTTNQRARRFYERCGMSTDGATKTVQRPGLTLHETRYRMDLT